MHDDRHLMLGFIGIMMILALLGLTGISQANPILDRLTTITIGPSTVPANGDVNPYGVARVEQPVGNLKKDHILVSNFNNSDNHQGVGSTIVDVAPDGTVSLFAQIDATKLPASCTGNIPPPGGVGLTTALVVLRSGWVIVGSLPTSDGTAATAQAGCLIVLDSKGNLAETFSGNLINGPWDMVAFETGNQTKLFVTNVLNDIVRDNVTVVNQGTVVRIDLKVSRNKKEKPQVQSMTVIGDGFSERTDQAALVIGPTGVGIDPTHQVLYVADTLNNRIQVIEDPLNRTTSAGTGDTLSEGGSLNGPLGLVVTPNGHILTVNGGDGNIIEITPQGNQVVTRQLDSSGSPPGAGALFGLAFDRNDGVYFVDNATNNLDLLGKR